MVSPDTYASPVSRKRVGYACLWVRVRVRVTGRVRASISMFSLLAFCVFWMLLTCLVGWLVVFAFVLFDVPYFLFVCCLLIDCLFFLCVLLA